MISIRLDSDEMMASSMPAPPSALPSRPFASLSSTPTVSEAAPPVISYGAAVTWLSTEQLFSFESGAAMSTGSFAFMRDTIWPRAST